MKTAISWINYILGFIPGNGKKTVTSFAFLAVAYLLKEHLDIETNPENLSEAYKILLQAKDLLVEALTTAGIVLLPVGVAHKGTKKIEKELTKKNDVTPMWEQ